MIASPPVIASLQDAVEYVKGFGYVNDERYASHYISGRIRTKSRQQIMRELMQKGLDRDTADRIWKELAETEEPQEQEMIREHILKKYNENTALNEKEMRRLYSFLTRRGFSMNDISKVLEEMKITVQYEKHKTIY